MKSPGESGSAVGLRAAAMPEHHDILDPQALDREFKRRQGGVIVSVRLVGRYQVGDVADNENLARQRVEGPLRCGP
jgi:hypothetical protein